MSGRYFIELSYDGTPFHGWQVQENAASVQGKINEVFSVLLKQKIHVVGCGRTDTGVHARKFYAHLNSGKMPGDLQDLAYRANRMLPFEIAVHRIFKVDKELHARFSAIARTYEYLIVNRKDPFSINKRYEFRQPLNVEQMQACADALFGYADFSSFSKSNTQTENNLCTIRAARWETLEDGYRFTVTANRFLRNMVRSMAGTMIEAGKEILSIEDFKKIIEAKDRKKAGFSVPGYGLYLIDIAYPEGSF